MCKTANFLGIFTILLLLGAGAVALADDEPAAREERRAEILERYDADGDGRLSQEERRAARERRRLERWDTDGDGEMSEEEHAAARQAMDDRRGGRGREQRASRFDTDGDGAISDEERAAAYEQRKLEREMAMEKYDADGDGRLSRSERESARADGARVGPPGGGRRGHGGFGRGGGPR